MALNAWGRSGRLRFIADSIEAGDRMEGAPSVSAVFFGSFQLDLRVGELQKNGLPGEAVAERRPTRGCCVWALSPRDWNMTKRTRVGVTPNHRVS